MHLLLVRRLTYPPVRKMQNLDQVLFRLSVYHLLPLFQHHLNSVNYYHSYPKVISHFDDRQQYQIHSAANLTYSGDSLPPFQHPHPIRGVTCH